MDESRQTDADQFSAGKEVDFHDLAEHFLGRVDEVAKASYPGIVNKDVKPSEMFDNLVDSMAAVFGGCDIPSDRENRGPL